MFNLLRQTLTRKTAGFPYHSDDEDFKLLPQPSGYRTQKRTRANSVHIVMNSPIQEPEKKEAAASTKQTGFHEPFSEDRNTTLPHPEADTSPNATIEAPDLGLTRTHSRNSFLRKHHHLWGRHDAPEKMGLYDNITYADEEVAPEEVDKPNGVDGAVEDGQRKKGILGKLSLHNKV